jgi:Tol biopolymer transport system component
MLRCALRLTGLAGLIATALPVAAVDIAIVNETPLAVALSTNGHSANTGSVSDDGRYALFFSEADNLVPGDTNRATDLFLYDHQDGDVERVNLGNGDVQANADTLLMADLSADTRYVVFESRATNLVGTDTHGTWQIYLRDRVAQTTTLISRGLDGSGTETGGYAPQISADGRYVIFVSYDRLVENDFNLSNDVYRYDRVGGTLEMISVSATGEIGDLGSDEARISADGRYVAFRTQATNLFAGDTNFASDIVLRDTVANINVNASLSPGGGQFGGARSLARGDAVSADGRYVLFNTDVSLESADTNASTDGFRFDRVTGQSARVTRGPGGALLQFGAAAHALSGDGNLVVMEATGSDLSGGPTPYFSASYVRNVTSGAITLVKLRPGSIDPYDASVDCNLSGDGGVAYCDSYSRNLTDADDTEFRDVFRSEIGADGAVRVSRPMSGTVAAANNYSGGLVAGASDDGRFVAFESAASNLVVGDNNGAADVFLRDRLAGTTQRISRTPSGGEAACASGLPRMTPDGRYVVFVSCGALVAPATGDTPQVYRYDRIADQLQLVSVNDSGQPCNQICREASISDDGSVIAFESRATNLGQTPGLGIFVRQLPAGPTLLVNTPNGGGIANGVPSNPQISGDGRFVVFSATSDNLVAGDTNNASDVFAYDRNSATLQRVSLGQGGVELQDDSLAADVSFDGSRVLFFNNNAGCVQVQRGLYVRDTVSGQTGCVSEDTPTLVSYPLSNLNSANISADGNRVAFSAYLAAGPDGSRWVANVLLHDRTDGRLHRITPLDMNRDAQILDLCAGGDCLLFSSDASNVVANDANNLISDVFIAQHLIDDTIFRNGFETP